MSVLHLHPRAVHVEDALAAALDAGGGAVVLGQGQLSARELIERAWGAAARPIRVGPLGERLLVDAVAAEASEEAGGLAGLAGSRGFGESLRALLGEWRAAGLTPGEVLTLGRRAGPSSRRLAALGRLYARYVERLGDRADEGQVIHAALATLAGGAPVPALAGVDRVIVHLAASDPRLLDLARALATRGLPVALELPLVAAPTAPRPLLERAIDPLARRIEELDQLPLEPRYLVPGLAPGADPGDDEADASPRARLLGQLFRRAADPRRRRVEDAPVELSAAPTPEVEARHVACRVRDLLAAGAAPDTVAVVARDPAQRDRVARWLSRYQVPFVERPGRPALASVPVRLALRLGELVDDGVPREALIALLSSRYVAGWIEAGSAGPAISPHQIARALREAGVRDASDEHGVPGYRRRLGELIRSASGTRRQELERIAEAVEGWLALLGTLPDEATVAAHAGALLRASERLGLRLLARGYLTDAEAGLDDVERVAFDQSAISAFERLLVDLPRAAARAGLPHARLDRRRFSRLLESALGAEAVRPGGARGGTVELTLPESIGGRRFAHVIACGLQDGVLPARAVEDALLDDDDRHRFNQLAGRDVLRRAAAREEQEPLVFLELCAAATTTLHLSYALGDAGGRPLLRSPFLDEIERATGQPPRPLDPDPVPRAVACRTPAELRARVALEAVAPREGRLGSADPDATDALVAALASVQPEEQAGLAAAAAVERDRLAFFDGAAPAGRYTGRIVEPSLLSALAEALPGSEARPLSASAIEDYARCGFRFFAARLLRVEPPEETGDDLDALAGGRLHHRVLERFYRALVEGGRLPLTGGVDELALLDQTLASVLDEWAAEGPSGHPALFAVRGRRVRRELRRLVRAEARETFFAPHRPSHFEHRFKVALPVAAVEGADGDREPVLHLHGAIDRIDVDGRSLVVIDYKTGRSSTYRKLLSDEALLVTSFQLPIYAAAARATLEAEVVSARYFAIRDAQPTEPLSDDGRFVLSSTTSSSSITATAASGHDPARATLGGTIQLLHRNMRAGDFAVAPRSCDFCALGAACRVVLRRGVADEGGEGGA